MNRQHHNTPAPSSPSPTMRLIPSIPFAVGEGGGESPSQVLPRVAIARSPHPACRPPSPRGPASRNSKLNRGEKACGQARSQRGRQGFSLIEVAVSSILVGSILVTAMTTTGAVLRFRSSSSDSARAAFLAIDLLSEILDQPYADPNQTPILGRESGETTRLQFDDADDYDGWTETPPATRAAVAIDGFTGWQRSVTVVYVQRNAPTLTSVTDEGLKRITVTISKNSIAIRTIDSLKVDF